MSTDFKSLKEFYPYYLTEHLDQTNRILHFIGTSIVIMLGLTALITQTWSTFMFVPLAGYGFAWVGHFFFERNKPATFKYPVWSLMSDFIMYFDTLNGSLEGKLDAAAKQFKKKRV
jgi:hypothetical protein